MQDQNGDKSPRPKGGFTLIELMVAAVIFLIIMTAIVTLFAASLRATKAGYLSMEAYEESRTAITVLERDLTTAFAARDVGASYQFYGTPIGMTFVGLVRSYEPSSADPNLGRLTYVLNQRYGAGSFDTVDPVTGTPVIITTYSLIRYVEPNTEDLDSVPVDWELLRADPEYSYIDTEFTAIEGLTGLGWSQGVVNELLKAKKRQLWIRFLSNSELIDPWVPNSYMGYLTDPADPNSPKDLGDPYDYIVASNIEAQAPPGLPWDDRAYAAEVFFRYGLTGAADILREPFWNADYTIAPLPPGGDAFTTATTRDPLNPGFVTLDGTLREELGTPFRPRLPEVIEVNVTWLYEKTHPAEPDFERKVDQLVIDVPCGYMRSPWWLL